MPESYQPTFENVTVLNDRDIDIILESLEIFKRTANNEPARAAEKKVKEVLEIDSDMPTTKFLYTVVRDYNYQTSGLE